MLGQPTLGPFARRAATALAIDIVCFLVGATLAWLVVRPPFPAHAYALVAVAGAVLATLALSWSDAYKPAVLGSAAATLRSVLMSMGFALAVAFVIYFAVQIPGGALPAMVHTAAFFFPLVLVGRAGFRHVSGRFRKRLVVLGTSDLGGAIARTLRDSPGLGIEVVGFLSDDDHPNDRFAGSPILGNLSHTEKVLKEVSVGWIVVAARRRDERFPADLLLAAKLRGLRVDSGLAFYERMAGRIYLPDLRWSTLIFADGVRERPVAAALKRIVDVAIAGLGLVVAAPFLALAAVAIKLDSPGPVLFRQARVGRGGRIFQIAKLRSMRDGAENGTGATFTCANDDRITRVGRVLRRTHLDEVPQLWNVLVGEMSMVGPRPERPEFVEGLSARLPLFRFRSLAKPGVTGWAQVRFGYTGDLEGFEQKLSHDLFYLKHRSLALDVAILWETLKEVVLLRGT